MYVSYKMNLTYKQKICVTLDYTHPLFYVLTVFLKKMGINQK